MILRSKDKRYTLYYMILYYFSFFYTLDIFNIGNSMIISGVKEILIIILFFMTFGTMLKVRGYLGFYIIYFLALIIAMIKSSSFGYLFVDLKYYFIWPLMIFISAELINNLERLIQLLHHLLIIGLIIGIWGLYAYFTNNSMFLQWRTVFQVNAIKSLLSTSFSYGALMALMVYVIVLLMYLNGISLARILICILFCLSTFLSYVRGSYLAAILLIYLLFRLCVIPKKFNLTGRKKISLLILDLLVLFICCYLLFHNAESEFLSTESLFARINGTWTASPDSILFGNGFGTVGRSENFSTSQYGTTDNSFYRIYLTMGILGLVSMIGILCGLYRIAENRKFLLNIYLSIGVVAFVSDYIAFCPAILVVYCLMGSALSVDW